MIKIDIVDFAGEFLVLSAQYIIICYDSQEADWLMIWQEQIYANTVPILLPQCIKFWGFKILA